MRQRFPYEEDPKLAEVAEMCKRSLHFLCHQFLGYTLWDEVHDDLEVMLKRPAQRKCIVLPRDHSKSTFVTIAWTIQQILKNPNIRVLIANGVWDTSRRFLSEIKAQLENSQLKYVFGDFVSVRWNADDIIVRQRTRPRAAPTISTTGVEAESTGSRADLIIADDLMGEQNYKTPEQREKVKRYRRSLVNLLEPGGIMVDLMTRWHLDDTFTDIVEKEREYYDVMVRKVVEDGKIIYPKKFSRRFDKKTKSFVASYDIVAPDGYIMEKILAPDHKAAEIIAQDKHGEEVKVQWNDDPNLHDYVDYLRKSKPPDEFASQYLNEPVSLETQVFKPETFKYWHEKPERLYIAMGCDLAISQLAGSDYTALVVMGMDAKRRLFVLDYLRGKWGPHDTVKNIFDMQAKWNPVVVGMEVNGFQRTYKLAVEEEMRRRNRYFAVAEVKNGPDKSKEWRIKKLEPFYRNGMVYHAAWMKGKDMETELMTFPKGRNDDIIDAEAMAIDYLAPGDSAPAQEAPSGSFEAVVNEARRNNGTGKGYFNVFW